MASESSSRTMTPGLKILIVVLVLGVLGVGAFAVVKLTKDENSAQPASAVAQDAVAAIKNGDDAELRDLATASGAEDLMAIEPSELSGLKFGGQCGFVGADPPTRACVFSRPGGQLTLTLIARGKTWLVDAAAIGPAGLPPETTSSTSTPTG